MIISATLGGRVVETTSDAVLASANPYASITPKFPTSSFPAVGTVNLGLVRNFLLVNDGTNPTDRSNPYPSLATTVTLNLASWGLPPGTPLVLSQTAAGLYGEVAGAWPLLSSASGNVTFAAPPYSTSVLSVPTVPHSNATVAASQDTSLVNGTALQADPSTGDLQVTTSAAGVTGALQGSTTSVAMVQFIVPQPSSSVSIALLQLAVSVPPKQNMTLTLVGVSPTNASTDGLIWGEQGASWATAGFAVTPGPLPAGPVAANFQVLGGGNSIVGHITVAAGTPAGTVKRIDVSQYIRSATVGPVTFVIARRLRNPGYVGNSAGPIPGKNLNPKTLAQNRPAAAGRRAASLSVRRLTPRRARVSVHVRPADTLSLGATVSFYSKETGAASGLGPSLLLFTPAALSPPTSVTMQAALSVSGYSSLSAGQQAR